MLFTKNVLVLAKSRSTHEWAKITTKVAKLPHMDSLRLTKEERKFVPKIG